MRRVVRALGVCADEASFEELCNVASRLSPDGKLNVHYMCVLLDKIDAGEEEIEEAPGAASVKA